MDLTRKQLAAIGKRANLTPATFGALILDGKAGRSVRSRVELVAEALKIKLPSDFFAATATK